MENGKLYAFMEEMHNAGCSPTFVVEQGYLYAVQEFREQQRAGCEQVGTRAMDMAARWVVAAALGLKIHPIYLGTEQHQSGSTRRRR